MWPLLTMNKGFFDGPAKTAAAATTSSLAAAAPTDEEAEGWDVEDVDIDGWLLLS